LFLLIFYLFATYFYLFSTYFYLFSVVFLSDFLLFFFFLVFCDFLPAKSDVSLPLSFVLWSVYVWEFWVRVEAAHGTLCFVLLLFAV